MAFMADLETHHLFLASVALLLLATQLVVLVLSILERRRFGTVLLGTLITPMCTGFPNLMIGLFGQERFQGDLVLQLNVGNNLANTSLVAGLLLLLAGPLMVRAGKGTSQAAVKANRAQAFSFLALWLGTLLLFVVARDGNVSRLDGACLSAFYLVYQAIAYRSRGKVGKKQRLGFGLGLLVLAGLCLAAWVIQASVAGLALVISRMEHVATGWNLGLFLGLLTVIPESFLLLRLASRQGSLGLSGLVGDCLVSIPLVIGVSAIASPFNTATVSSWSDPGARPYLALVLTMGALSLLSLKKKPVPRKVGLLFILLYGTVWMISAK